MPVQLFTKESQRWHVRASLKNGRRTNKHRKAFKHKHSTLIIDDAVHDKFDQTHMVTVQICVV